MQLHRQREQFEVGFRPIHGIGQRGGGIEYALQPAEAAVAADDRSFFLSCGSALPVQCKRRPYGLDVSPQFLLPVKRHIPRYIWLPLRSARYIDGRIRATGRSRPKGDNRKRSP